MKFNKDAILVGFIFICVLLIFFITDDQKGVATLSAIAAIIALSSYLAAEEALEQTKGSLDIATNTLKETKQANSQAEKSFRATENALIVSMTEQRIHESSESLSKFYNPLVFHLNLRNGMFLGEFPGGINEGIGILCNPLKHPDITELTEIFRFKYLADKSTITLFDACLEDTTGEKMDLLRKNLKDVIKQKEDEIERMKEIIKKIEDSA
jgi:hypothetical protein